jgi:hypothetical protein
MISQAVDLSDVTTRDILASKFSGHFSFGPSESFSNRVVQALAPGLAEIRFRAVLPSATWIDLG